MKNILLLLWNISVCFALLSQEEKAVLSMSDKEIEEWSATYQCIQTEANCDPKGDRAFSEIENQWVCLKRFKETLHYFFNIEELFTCSSCMPLNHHFKNEKEFISHYHMFHAGTCDGWRCRACGTEKWANIKISDPAIALNHILHIHASTFRLITEVRKKKLEKVRRLSQHGRHKARGEEATALRTIYKKSAFAAVIEEEFAQLQTSPEL